MVYQFSWFSWRVRSMNSRTHEMVIFCMNYERKQYGHKIWTPWMCHFFSPQKLIHTKNITTQSVASPRTPHLSMITIVTFTFELWPPKSIGFTMVNMSAKSGEEAHNGLVSIRFSLFSYLSPVNLTFDLWPPKSIGSILSPKLTSLQSLMKKYATV